MTSNDQSHLAFTKEVPVIVFVMELSSPEYEEGDKCPCHPLVVEKFLIIIGEKLA